jgi:hypothetical protein
LIDTFAFATGIPEGPTTLPESVPVDCASRLAEIMNPTRSVAIESENTFLASRFLNMVPLGIQSTSRPVAA